MTEPTLVLRISDSGTSALDGLTSSQLHALGLALRGTAMAYAPHVKVLTHFDVRKQNTPTSLVIDVPAREVILNGSVISFSRSEFDIFTYLAQHPRVVIGRAELNASDSGRSTDVHLSRIRTKLGTYGRLITTVRGIGYRFDPEPGVHIVSEPVALRTA